jgi:hypothetical protein
VIDSGCVLQTLPPPRTRARRCVSFAAGLFGLLCSVNTHAAELDPLKSLQLQYEAPAGCGSLAEVQAKLREALGNGAAPVVETRAEVSIRPASKGVVLSYRALQGEVESRRTLALDSCAVASDAAALLLLLTLDPLLAESLGAAIAVESVAQVPEELPSRAEPPPATQSKPRPQPVPQERPPAVPQTKPPIANSAQSERPPRDAREPRSPPPPAQAPWLSGGWLAVGGSALTAVTPRVAFGVGVEGGVRVGLVRVGARGGFDRALTRAFANPEGALVRASVLRAHLLAALDFGSPAFRFGPWVSLGWEHLSAEVTGISAPQPGATTLFASAAGGEIELTIERGWGFMARAGVLVPLERPRFRVAGIEELVHEPGPLGADLFFGVFWSWGSQN